MAALGVVFGDIGTSPLYAFKLCFSGDFPAAVTPANVFGILSLIFWALLIVVCIKYVTFMLRADHDGQGGTLALLALLLPARRNALPFGLSTLALFVLFGSAMLYGDGAITPAISVISAVEGLDVWTAAAHPFIVPISVVVLLLLFGLQSRGTSRIGKLFGPVMVVWFSTIAVSGIFGIVRHPSVYQAVNPYYAFVFFAHNGWRSLLIFGAVVLCVTGVEALYADLAHFGRRPITLAWYGLVLPALVLNYFGQGAITLADPRAIAAPFFALVPRSALIPVVLLATAATVIASQALISGIYSLTQQASQLGYAPRFRIVHTSRHYAGQIFMPTITAMLGIVCILLVVGFRSSDALGGAYGLAVTITMLATTVTFFFVLRNVWHWSRWRAGALIALFLLWDLPFLAGNLSKVASGGWMPLLMASVLFVLFVTWNRGRRRMMLSLSEQTMPVDQFLRGVKDPTHGSGTAFFLAPDTEGIPFMLQHRWLREHIIFDTIVLLTIVNASRPYVHSDNRLEIEQVAPRLLRVKALYGFMQRADINDILHQLRKRRPESDFKNPTYYLASPKITADAGRHGLPSWQRALFRWMARNARPLTDSLGLPPNSTVEFGVEVKI